MTIESDIDGVAIEPEDDTEVYGVVVEMLGASRVLVRCMDGEERICRIPGRMKNKVWISEDDIVIVEPWEWQDEKGDIVHKYGNNEVKLLEDENLIG